MNVSRAALVLALCALAPAGAGAQERVIHDTLSADTPTAVTCGFCATERFGVVFRELPSPRRGIEPEDFPIRLEAVQIAMAAATVTPGPTCTPSETGGTILAPIEIYAGSEVPTGAISSLPADGPWSSTEELVWAADAPLTLSVAEPGTGGRYNLSFNEIIVRDESDAVITVDAGTYLRVVVTLPAAEPAAACTGGLDLPGGFPFRDSDGRIAPERGFIYAAGVGWLWNEQASIDGDWGVRLTLFRAAPRDGGTMDLDAGSSDAGTRSDAGATLDAGARADAGDEPAGGGCSCRAAPGSSSAWWLFPAVALALALRRRRSDRGLRWALCGLALSGCANEIPIGEPCPDGRGCGAGGVCSYLAEARDPRCTATTPGPLEAQGTACLEPCTTADVLCAGGELCLPDFSDPTVGSCWLGGPVALGEACCTLQDCELGAVCVARAEGEAGLCRRACVPTIAEADCPTGQSCEALAYGIGACG